MCSELCANVAAPPSTHAERMFAHPFSILWSSPPLPGLIRHTHLQRQRRSSLGLPCNLRNGFGDLHHLGKLLRLLRKRLDLRYPCDAPRGASLIHIDVAAPSICSMRALCVANLLHLATCLTGRSRGSAPLHETLCVAPVSYRQRHSALFTTWDDSMTRKWSIPVDGCHRR